MKVEKRQTETYVITDIKNLDPVTVYVTNYKPGQGKIVIECFGESWSYYWGGMGDHTLQEFMIRSDNDYLLSKLVGNTVQIDYDHINNELSKNGFDLCVTNESEIAYASKQMEACFGEDWHMDMSYCRTDEYHYVNRILNVIKEVFKEVVNQWH